MVMIMMHSYHHHQGTSTPLPSLPPLSYHNNPSLSSPISLKSPNSISTPTPTAQPHSFNHLISLGHDNYVPTKVGHAQAQDSACPVLDRVKLPDILPYGGGGGNAGWNKGSSGSYIYRPGRMCITINKADELLSSSLNKWGSLLSLADNINPIWAQILSDPFLRILILRQSSACMLEHLNSKNFCSSQQVQLVKQQFCN